ncbi:MAG TPA: ABC transporter ATP-binding protein [Clostridia bacterium]|nr:ABC transporter ATP-binding protein [Clostridia bacterium]
MIKITNLRKVFNEGERNQCIAINDISLQIKDGECVAIIGKSGSGKSTLLNILSGIDRATNGTIIVDNNEITKLRDNEMAKYRAKNIGIVMQDFCLIEECTALDNVMLPLNFIKMKAKNRINRAISLINGVEMGHYIKKPVYELSGGEKQRIAIARALASDSRYLFCDEPTGSLDAKTSKDIIDMLLRINDKGKTVIIITHDLNVAKRCKRIIELHDGSIINDKIEE